MTPRSRAMWLLGIQMLIVCLIAGKYWYERATCPRVWVRVQGLDPEMPVRGRYLALTPLVDACALPPEPNEFNDSSRYVHPYIPFGSREWPVTIQAANGTLRVIPATRRAPMSVELSKNGDCHRAPLSPAIDLFIPENSQLPRQEPHEEFWMEVTVPPAGPPRAIQLATSLDGKWQPLKFN